MPCTYLDLAAWHAHRCVRLAPTLTVLLRMHTDVYVLHLTWPCCMARTQMCMPCTYLDLAAWHARICVCLAPTLTVLLRMHTDVYVLRLTRPCFMAHSDVYALHISCPCWMARTQMCMPRTYLDLAAWHAHRCVCLAHILTLLHGTHTDVYALHIS